LVINSVTIDWPLFIGESVRALQFTATLGLVLGVGATTVADILFLSFLKDLRISVEESSILKVVSQITWLGIALLLLADGLLYFGMPNLLAVPAHAAGLLLIAVIAANAIFLNLFVAPKLVRISFGEVKAPLVRDLLFVRRFAISLLAVSLVSWYSLFVVYFLGDVLYSLSDIATVYIGVVLVTLLLSWYYGKSIGKQKTRRTYRKTEPRTPQAERKSGKEGSPENEENQTT